MIRILHCLIGNMNIGGLENNLMTIYRNLDKTKYQFDFITHSKDNYYSHEIQKMGGKLFYTDYISKNPIMHYKQLKQILINHTEYKIIHVHTSYALMYYDAKAIKKFSNSILILHSHASYGNGKKQILINRLLKNKLNKLPDYKIAVSKDAAKWLFDYNTIKNKTYFIINNSINTDKFYFDEELRCLYKKKYKLEGKYVLGITARIDKIKNISFLIDVLYLCLQKYPNMVLCIVGEGSDSFKVKKKANLLGISENVLFLGEHSDINGFLNMFDIFLFSSLHEGLGISVLEAICTGLPCIINIDLPEELSVNDLVIREKLEPVLWKKKIEYILEEKKSVRNTLSNDIAKAGFGIRQNTHKWQKFYASIVQQHNL